MVSITPQKPHVCFYCLSCYPLFNPECICPFGGWETRISIIAKELAKRGNFDVTIFVANYGQPHIEYREGVRLISWPGPRVGSPADEPEATDPIASEPEAIQPGTRRKSLTRSMEDWFRKQNFSRKTKVISIFLIKELIAIVHNFFVSWLDALITIIKTTIRSIIRLLNALKQSAYLSGNIFDILDSEGSHIVWHKDIEMFDEVQADIYVVPGNHRTSAVAASYCQVRQKKYIFLAGSDYDYYPEYKTDSTGSDMYGVSNFQKVYAIEHADLHIVQTQWQANMLNQGYGRKSVVIRNPIDLNKVYPRSATPETILWVGKSDERIKRPSMILELARRLPDHPFVVILNKADPHTHALNIKEARFLPNLTVIEHVPFDEVEKYYAAAHLFVNTSVFEGFPNTFLQAAKYGVPIVATDIDPDGMLSKHGCGITCGGDFERFVGSVQRMMRENDLYVKTSNAVLNYVRTYHDKEVIISQYEKEFRDKLAPTQILIEENN